MACIGIAFFFWILNKLSHAYRSARPVQLEYRLPPGKAFSEEPVRAVKAIIQGKGWDFILNKRAVVPVVVNADNYQVIQSYKIRDRVAEQLGFGPESVAMDFEEIKLKVEDEVTKTLPVKVNADVDFHKGYALSRPIAANPSSATVSGPKSILDTLQFIETDTLRLSKLREDAVQIIKIAERPLLKYSVKETEAKLFVEQFTEKSLFVTPVILNAPMAIRIFPNKIKVTCTLALSRYANLAADQFEIIVDFKGMSSGMLNATNIAPIKMTKQPEGIREVDFTPKSVEFFFEKNGL